VVLVRIESLHIPKCWFKLNEQTVQFEFSFCFKFHKYELWQWNWRQQLILECECKFTIKSYCEKVTVTVVISFFLNWRRRRLKTRNWWYNDSPTRHQHCNSE
jgi:hypothetical protein